MMIDNCLKTNPADISEGFNAYFSSIAEKLLPKHTDGTKHFSEYLSDRVNTFEQNGALMSAASMGNVTKCPENNGPRQM